ncbi:helix-turn-helix domain-containing protein [Natrinema sp. 1APR25-10V2]|uniref:helix-turn-helix domain-containing protein n=1 Tax=Natrinema sp. 1APR25-10V2 TaxID=2951081 RepID=UPI00287636E4|nr:helix-turn-helix domain-containing protein [Natrinema sp. 1APR25-10V2]MDS0477684.1 helix-turn-helix domain-containing protein [Natrinema sp. 1APR25-10V2]
MPHATLTIRIPESLWIHEISTAYPDTAFRVISVLVGPDVSVAVIELATPNPVPIIASIDERDDVGDLELLWKHDDTALLQIETADQSVLTPMQRAGVPVETPFVVEDGVVTWELTTSADRLSTLGDLLEESDIGYRLESVHDIDGRTDHLLTDRQREVFLTALDEGYYDVPRAASLTDVAARLEISKSTCSDILHRAEGKIAHWFADERLGRRSNGR